MQHYGVPTRLLDWTESLPVALHFTVRPLDLDLVAPTIWVLDPFSLFQLSDPDRTIIPISISPEVIRNADLAFDEGEDKPDISASVLPIPVAPDFVFNRLAVQNGAFTIHGTDTRPLEDMIPSSSRQSLLKFVASVPHLDRIYSSIDLLKPSSDAIFPDMEGLIDYIV